MAFLTRARRAFYNADGPWYRNRMWEAMGSTRFAHPAMFDMDRLIAGLIPGRRGTFLEAGAHDGYTQSNTYFLERHLGWSGILVEPVPELRAKCERRRPRSQVVGCALVGPDHAAQDVEIHFGDLMSSTQAADHAAGGLAVTGRDAYTVSVPARTLEDVIERSGAGRLDVMVLDLEGREHEVLSGLDLERHGPTFLLVEALDPQAARPGLEALLADHYDPRPPASPYDLLFARRG